MKELVNDYLVITGKCEACTIGNMIECILYISEHCLSETDEKLFIYGPIIINKRKK